MDPVHEAESLPRPIGAALAEEATVTVYRPCSLSLLLLCVCAVAGCGPGGDDPQTQSCSSPGSASIASFSIYDASFDEDVVDGGILQIARGGQGSNMAVLEYRFAATQAPACITHESRLSACMGNDCTTIEHAIAESHVNLRVEEDGSGWRTATLFLVVALEPPYGSHVRLDVTLAGTTQSLELLWEADGEALACDEDCATRDPSGPR